MELRMPTPKQLETVYDAHLKKSFPDTGGMGVTGPGVCSTEMRLLENAFCGWGAPAGPCWTFCVSHPSAATAEQVPFCWKRCGSRRLGL